MTLTIPEAMWGDVDLSVDSIKGNTHRVGGSKMNGQVFVDHLGDDSHGEAAFLAAPRIVPSPATTNSRLMPHATSALTMRPV